MKNKLVKSYQGCPHFRVKSVLKCCMNIYFFSVVVFLLSECFSFGDYITNRCRIMLIVPSGNINHNVLLIIWCQHLKVKAFPELSPLKGSFCLKLSYKPVNYFTVPASFLRHIPEGRWQTMPWAHGSSAGGQRWACFHVRNRTENQTLPNFSNVEQT